LAAGLAAVEASAGVGGRPVYVAAVSTPLGDSRWRGGASSTTRVRSSRSRARRSRRSAVPLSTDRSGSSSWVSFHRSARVLERDPLLPLPYDR